MEGASSKYEQRFSDMQQVAEEMQDYALITPEFAIKKIHQLEQTMYEHARNLEFEEASKVRDEIQRLKSIAFENPAAQAS